MQSVADARPCPGLSVPVVTALSPEGALLEEDQRALVRFVIQQGRGADLVFAAGTTGEWDRLPPELLRRAVQICAEEVARANAALQPVRPVETWAGISAQRPQTVLENLGAAISAGADAAVLAPLSLQGGADAVQFVARELADYLDCAPRRIPLYLYDNADIAAQGRAPHIRTRQVKALSRLDFVRGIKVSAPPRVLGHYTKAAANFRERGEFGIYVGNAMQIFEIFRPRSGWLAPLRENLRKRRMRGGLPVGVVAGPANAMPREWARAWQLCRAGDAERMAQVQQVLQSFKAAAAKAGELSGRKCSIACLKRALFLRGVISSAAVAEGTPRLGAEAAAHFDSAFQKIRTQAAQTLQPAWVTSEHRA